MSLPEMSAFRLVGGTSLALQIGHRTSVDIDLFTDKDFNGKAIQLSLHENFSSFQMLWQNENGFSAQIDGVKIDIFNWRLSFIESAIIEDGIRMMAVEEVGAMKFEAITGRKTKKDFIDIFFLLKRYPLSFLIEKFRVKYPFIDYKFVIESLMAIDEADNSEEPLMKHPLDWTETKTYILDSVNNYIQSRTELIANQREERIKKAEELLRRKKDK